MFNIKIYQKREREKQRQQEKIRQLNEIKEERQEYKVHGKQRNQNRIKEYLEKVQKEKLKIKDDHYMLWDQPHQFRTLQLRKQPSFKFKSNQDIPSIYSERQRNQMQYNNKLTSKYLDKLVRSSYQKLKSTYLNRNLQSTQPFEGNKDVYFRHREFTKQKQPPMRFTATTDQQRTIQLINQKKLNPKYFDYVYKKFQAKKQRIGKVSVFPSQRASSSKRQMMSSDMTDQLQFVSKLPSKFLYGRQTYQKMVRTIQLQKLQNRQEKHYWKSFLVGKKGLLQECQAIRRKDLSNIKN